MRWGHLVLAAAVWAAPCVASAATQDLTVVNRTGYRIDRIYVGEVGSSDWGNDVMGRDRLEDGERVDISFDRQTRACHWNLMVEYHDATKATWADLDLCEISNVALFWDKLSRTTVARVE